MDNQTMFNHIDTANEDLGNILKICEAMEMIVSDAEEKAVKRLADGIFGLLAVAVDNIYDKLNKVETSLIDSGAKGPLELDKAGLDAYCVVRGRWV